MGVRDGACASVHIQCEHISGNENFICDTYFLPSSASVREVKPVTIWGSTHPMAGSTNASPFVTVLPQ